MLKDSQIRSVALFYYFTLLEEKAAHLATLRIIDKIKNRIEKAKLNENEVPAALVHLMHKSHRQVAKITSRSSTAESEGGGWILPTAVDLGAWRAFKKEADSEEFLAVVWSQILRLKDEDISRGLGVSVGTVRHRVGRGLKILGGKLIGRSA